MNGSVSFPKDNFRSYFTFQTITVVNNLTIAKNDHSYNEYDVLPQIAGYEPVCITDFSVSNADGGGTGLTWIFPYRLGINSAHKVYLGLRNTNLNAAGKVKFTCKVMYVASRDF